MQPPESLEPQPPKSIPIPGRLVVMVSGFILVMAGLFLPVLSCKSSGYWECTQDELELLRTDFFDDGLGDGIAGNIFGLALATTAVVVLGAALRNKGSKPASLTLLGLTAYLLYWYWYQAEKGFNSSMLSLNWVGWIALWLGVFLILGSVFYSKTTPVTIDSLTEDTGINQEE